MATIYIYGRECTFQGIPVPILEQYGPTHSTHVCYFRATRAEDSMFLQQWLHMMARLQLIDRLHLVNLGSDMVIHLFDYMSDSHALQDLERYGSALCGTNFLVTCPWRRAVFGEAENQLRQISSVIEAAIDYEKKSGHKLKLPPEFSDIYHKEQERIATVLSNNKGDHV